MWATAAVVITYLAMLFLIAFVGDRYFKHITLSPYVYALATGIHCTSWAFFGTVTQASQYGWAIIPTYVGMSFAIIFAFATIQRIATLCQQHNISSLADFVGLLYGGSHSVAATISVICFIGVVPYIALQIDALTMSLNILTNLSEASSATVSMYIAALMAVFAILFGTRSLFLADKHPGLMLSIAFESAVKLIAFVVVGVYICFSVFDGFADIVLHASKDESASAVLSHAGSAGAFISHVILGACCMFILPRQFHVSFVELNSTQELRTARWFLPVFLFAMTVFVLPIALAGHLLLPTQGLNSDTFMLAIPMNQNSTVMALIAFVGGLSATTSMIIVSTLAMGIMIANNIATPLWLRLSLRRQGDSYMKASSILTVRRITVMAVLAAAYWYHINISQNTPLVKSGVVAMALMAQILVPMMFGLYWQKANRLSALLGLTAGLVSWFVYLLLPSILSSYYFNPIPTDQALGIGFLKSIGINFTVYLGTGLLLVFLGLIKSNKTLNQDTRTSAVTVRLDQLLALTQRTLDAKAIEQIQRGLPDDALHSNKLASPALIANIEAQLAARVGSPGARLLLSTLASNETDQIEDLVDWVEKAQQDFHFNHEVLQSSVQHIQQGICVIDNDHKLLAWNERYLDLFDYPSGFISVGMPLRRLLEFNAQRGLFGDGPNAGREIEKRINFIAQGSKYKYIRKQVDGRVIELNGSPLPGGGYVTTFSDITEYIEIQRALEQAKTDLERRVDERTTQLNEARLAAERANDSKTRFLAAAGHDLMQPFNAATLFADMLRQKTENTELSKVSEGLNASLRSAEDLLTSLLDITKLESGTQRVNKQTFRLHDILQPLFVAMRPLAEKKGLSLRYCESSLWVESDPVLLRRMVQNLLANAIRYTDEGGILVGVRRQGKAHATILVIDTGVGVSDNDLSVIFDEFRQLNPELSNQGLGLGLTIVARIAELLNHPLDVSSTLNKGTAFSINVNRKQALVQHSTTKTKTLDEGKNKQFLRDQTILIVENDLQILDALTALLSDWGATVIGVTNVEEAKTQCPSPPFCMIVDYQLDNDENGLDAANIMSALWGTTVLSIMSSANLSAEVREQCTSDGLHYLPKPLKPLALKRLLKQSLRQNLHPAQPTSTV
ncbi:PAS domain-containing hybrid sensor histidine kinase/response regulator [Alteromonas sediminis]|uniref:PAS domain-containing hybrid sensor histidine kinase/response regulator n=1 Tax=Alteromonas sediminis TaxID=2259342 RepID=UPI0030B840D1